MDKPTTMKQVSNGFRAAGVALLGLAWLGLVLGGMMVAFEPSSNYPRVTGWVALALAAVALLTTAHYWVKVLPGLLGIATLNATVSIFTKHATNLGSVPISRSDALIAALLLAASTALSFSFISRKLNILDRFVFLIYVSCIFWGAVDHRVTLPVQIGIATFCLFSAWACNFIQHPRGDKQQTVLT